MRPVYANQATASKRRVYFQLVDATDGMTPETGEAGGQPQISTNGGAWTNTGIGTLSAIGNGRYSADLTQAAVATAGDVIQTRYKSANTAECPGDTALVTAIDLDDAADLGLSTLDVAVSTRAAAGATVTVVDPVDATTGDITIIRGDAYNSTLGNVLSWTSTGWPNISSATINFTLRRNDGTVALTKAGTAASATQATVALTGAETAALTVGAPAYRYDVQATISGDRVTLALGNCTVTEDHTIP